jgi:hypothetical protein
MYDSLNELVLLYIEKVWNIRTQHKSGSSAAETENEGCSRARYTIGGSKVWTVPYQWHRLSDLYELFQPEYGGEAEIPRQRNVVEAGDRDIARHSQALFAQRRNLVAPRFLAMLRDINRFNAKAVQLAPDDAISLALTAEVSALSAITSSGKSRVSQAESSAFPSM